MRLSVIGTAGEMEAVREEWLELWRQCADCTPFQSPQWLLPWMRRVYGGGEILLLMLREEDRLIGLVPLFCWGTESRCISFLGAGISDYGDALFAPGREGECAQTCRTFLLTQRVAGTGLDLQELREGSALLTALSGDISPAACSVCPALDLREYPAAMDTKHRTDVRRARNRLEKAGGLRPMLADRETLESSLEVFFRLHEARWNPLSASLRGFYREAAAGFLETGNLRLAVLRTGDTPAASIYAITANRTLYCYLSGFDPALAKLSPGGVLLGWLIDQAIAEGSTRVDFLRKQEAYKYLWGARDHTTFQLRTRGTAC